MSLSIFESAWEVERVDTFIRVEIDIEICPSYRIDQCSVLILRIEDDDVCPKHEGTEDLKLDSE